jgi:hypothetical protein
MDFLSGILKDLSKNLSSPLPPVTFLLILILGINYTFSILDQYTVCIFQPNDFLNPIKLFLFWLNEKSLIRLFLTISCLILLASYEKNERFGTVKYLVLFFFFSIATVFATFHLNSLFGQDSCLTEESLGPTIAALSWTSKDLVNMKYLAFLLFLHSLTSDYIPLREYFVGYITGFTFTFLASKSFRSESLSYFLRNRRTSGKSILLGISIWFVPYKGTSSILGLSSLFANDFFSWFLFRLLSLSPIWVLWEPKKTKSFLVILLALVAIYLANAKILFSNGIGLLSILGSTYLVAFTG